jgi:hypothetical protein
VVGRRHLDAQPLDGAPLHARPAHVPRVLATRDREQPRPLLQRLEPAQLRPRAQGDRECLGRQIDRELGIERPPGEEDQHRFSLAFV